MASHVFKALTPFPSNVFTSEIYFCIRSRNMRMLKFPEHNHQIFDLCLVDKASVSCDRPAYNLPPRLSIMWDRAPPSKCYCLLKMPTTCHWASSLLVKGPTWVFWLFLHPPDNAGTLQFDRVSYFCSKWCLFSSLWSIPALQSVFLHTWRGKDISWHGHCLLNGQVGSLTINSGRGIFSQRNQRKNNSLTE